MGFGINELRILYDTLMEIAIENNTENKTFENIKKEFFNDLKNYDEILRSRNEKDRLQKDIKNLEIKLEREKENNNAYPRAIESIQKLSIARIYVNDIIKIENIISKSGTSLYRNNISKYKQILMDDLQKYGNLKLAIQKLEDKKRKILILKSNKKIKSKSEPKKRKE
ncbi:MAG: hypothetical protein AB7H53_19350 [Hyphomicrobium sp.]